jgi:3-hydroxybutyryl-CoA dehydrogenase
MPDAMGVIGAGTMGVGVAYVFAAAGFRAHVVEPDAGRAEALGRVVAAQAARGVERGKLGAEEGTALPGRIRPHAAVDELPEGLDLIVECVPERLDLKQRVLEAAERRNPTILATNTSSISIDALAAGLRRPAAFLGMHFFNPVWSLQLVELIRGTATPDALVDEVRAIVTRLGKQVIVARDVPGFATSRLDFAAALEAMRMLEDGVASAEDIDLAATLAYRHPVGPLRLSDIVGLDVRLDIATHLAGVYGERFAPPAILAAKVAAGELGQKSGRGFFDW